jgi:hypothetical protein
MFMTRLMSEKRLWSQVVACAWSDEDFKQRLLRNPRVVLAEQGLEMPGDVEVQVVEDTRKVRHFILPPSPAGELADEVLVGSAAMDMFCEGCGGCGGCGCGSGGCGCGCEGCAPEGHGDF